MSKSQNIHDTLKWKKRRKHKGADKCGNAKCMVCHGAKILNIPDRQIMRADSSTPNILGTPLF